MLKGAFDDVCCSVLTHCEHVQPRLVVFRSATQDSELEELLKRLDIN